MSASSHTPGSGALSADRSAEPAPGKAQAVWLGLRRWVRTHHLETAFIALGLLVRLVFWQVTHRRFEDGLITVTHARSVLGGFGLTHHPFEPVTHGFTSAISVLVPLSGEVVGEVVPLMDGFMALRLSSLVAFVATIVAAGVIAKRLGLGTWPRVFAYGILTLSFNQIYYAMSGMETQVAVAILLWAIVAGMERRPVASGVLYGLCILVRPDFVIFVGLALAWWLWQDRRAALRVALIAGAVLLPWVAFTTLYYGSPIPNTIPAKALRYPIDYPHSLSPSAWWHFITTQVDQREGWLWRTFSPFYEHVFVNKAPFLPVLATWFSGAILLLGVVGMAISRQVVGWKPVIGFVVIYFAYRMLALPATYYDWYYPPLTALLALNGAVALQRLSTIAPRTAAIPAVLVVAAFAWALPALFVLEHRYQADVEDQVRQPLGIWLRDNVPAGSTVTSESAGYVGYYSGGNIRLWDYPGLTSKEAFAIMKALGSERSNLQWLVHAARPDYAIWRPDELAAFNAQFPATAALYEQVAAFSTPTNPADLRWSGVEFAEPDKEFVVMKRVRGTLGGVERARELVAAERAAAG